MLDGLAYCQILLDRFVPVDFLYLDVNPAFIRLTGLGNVVGKRASEVLPGLQESNPDLIQTCGRVALSGVPERFESYLPALDAWFEVSVFSPQMGFFLAQLDNISGRKKAEQQLARVRGLYEALRQINQTLVRARDEAELFQAICDVTVQHGGADAAWIGLGPAGSRALAPAAATGTPLGRLPEAARFGSWSSVPLTCRGRTVGDLVLMAVAPGVFESKDEGELLEELAADLAFALDSLQTKREKAEMEEAARKSGSLLRTIFEGVSDSFVFTGPDRKIRLVNTAFERLFGYSPNEIIGKSTQFLYADRAAYARDRSLIREAFPESGRQLDVNFRRRDGSTFWAEVSISPIVDPEGRSLGYFGAIHNVSERRRVVADLVASEARYRVLAENTTDVIWTIDGETREFTYISPSVEKQTGYTVAEALAIEPDQRLLPEFSELSEAEFQRRYQAWQDGARVTYLDEFEQARKDGSKFWVEISTRFDLNPLTGRLEIFGVTRDITERKRLWGQLLQAQKLESLGTLSAGIAHDFNNLLSVILSTVYLAELVPSDPQVLTKRFGSIKKAALRGASLVKQLLVIARKSELQLASVDLNAVVQEVIRILVETFPKTIELRQDLGKVGFLLADEAQLHQVVLNLCVNAKDSMPQGGRLCLRTSRVAGSMLRDSEPRATALEYACLEVEDSGMGMDSALLTRIFEPFFTTKDRGKGSGLGLTMAVGILESHHGWIHVESVVGKGTVFRCYLPVPERKLGGRPSSNGTAASAQGAGKTVLLVEDEPDILVALQEVLEKAGYRVLTAEDGGAGWSLFQMNGPDISLVVTSQGLPQVSGTELVLRVRTSRPGIPVVLLCGSSSAEELADFNADPLQVAIHKPFAPEDLLACMSRLLERRPFW